MQWWRIWRRNACAGAAGEDVIVTGGPNGAGKSTLANRIIPAPLGLRHFLNADALARGLSPYDPDDAAIPAGRLLIKTIDDRPRRR
jgi:predicted ABC-type ATPase